MSFEIYKNDKIVAGNSLRDCLTTDNPYSGFSICSYTGDSSEHIAACRRKLADFVGVGPDEIVECRQTHSTNVYVVESIDDVKDPPYGYDAVVTRLPNVVVGVNTADCVPVVLYDEQAGVIGAAHAGWRGALAGVVTNAVDKMVELGSETKNITAFFGPSIGQCCFEVGDEVAEQFPDEFVSRKTGEKPHVDLAGFVRSQLINSGLAEENVVMNNNCTRCHPDRYFSARALGIDSGRIFTFVGRKEGL